jgi:hypothetical protein
MSGVCKELEGTSLLYKIWEGAEEGLRGRLGCPEVAAIIFSPKFKGWDFRKEASRLLKRGARC